MTLLVVGLLATGLGSPLSHTVVPVVGRAIALSLSQLLVIGSMALLLRAAGQFAAALMSARLSAAYEAGRRMALAAGFRRAEWNVQAEQRAGALQDVVTVDVELGRVALDAVATGLTYLAGLLLLLAASLFVSIKATAAIILAALIFSKLLSPLARRAQQLAAKRAALNSKWAREVNESIRLAKEYWVFDRGGRSVERLGDQVLAMRELRRQGEFVTKSTPIVYQTLVLALALAGIGSIASGSGSSAAAAAAVALLLVRAASYSQGVQTNYYRFYEHLPFLDRVAAKVQEFERSRAQTGGEALPDIQHIVAEQLAFAYGTGPPVLSNVNFSITKGEIVGVVGASGAGKSTLMHLLLRLNEPTSGTLRINGRPAVKFSRDAWFRRFAFVPQTPLLLDADVADNIRFYRPEVDDPALRSAAAAAYLTNDRTGTAVALSTEVGEGGAALSGGQRQRVCIARALAGHPDVIIFDEPTSSLDAESELVVRRTLASLRGRVTLFIVAHRDSTLSICDRFLLLEDGALRQFGSLGELAAHDRRYQAAAGN